jgi:hypothetical protein
MHVKLAEKVPRIKWIFERMPPQREGASADGKPGTPRKTRIKSALEWAPKIPSIKVEKFSPFRLTEIFKNIVHDFLTVAIRKISAVCQKAGQKIHEGAGMLGLSTGTIELYKRGTRRDDGRAVVIPKTVELACAALALGIRKYDGPQETA